MPGLTGVELLEEIERLHPEIDGVVITGNMSAASLQPAEQHGLAACCRRIFVPWSRITRHAWKPEGRSRHQPMRPTGASAALPKGLAEFSADQLGPASLPLPVCPIPGRIWRRALKKHPFTTQLRYKFCTKD